LITKPFEANEMKKVLAKMLDLLQESPLPVHRPPTMRH
jgi:hypothetical protein